MIEEAAEEVVMTRGGEELLLVEMDEYQLRGKNSVQVTRNPNPSIKCSLCFLIPPVSRHLRGQDDHILISGHKTEGDVWAE